MADSILNHSQEANRNPHFSWAVGFVFPFLMCCMSHYMSPPFVSLCGPYLKPHPRGDLPGDFSVFFCLSFQSVFSANLRFVDFKGFFWISVGVFNRPPFHIFPPQMVTEGSAGCPQDSQSSATQSSHISVVQQTLVGWTPEVNCRYKNESTIKMHTVWFSMVLHIFQKRHTFPHVFLPRVMPQISCRRSVRIPRISDSEGFFRFQKIDHISANSKKNCYLIFSPRNLMQFFLRRVN